jgi:hypothetical protein
MLKKMKKMRSACFKGDEYYNDQYGQCFHQLIRFDSNITHITL